MTPAFTHQTESDLRRYLEDRAHRTLRHLDFAATIRRCVYQYRDAVHTLESDGALVLPGFFPRDAMVELGHRFDTLIAEGRCLTPPKDRAFKLVGAASSHLPLRERVSSIGLDDPLVSMPQLVPLAFDERILDMATAYFQTVPLLSFAKARKSFVNEIPASPTQHFHVDIGTYSIFKVLLYLNDVGPGGGPFCYVKGSHRTKFDGWEGQRYTLDEMAERYDRERVVRFHAEAGDAIVVESAGFHGGEKPRAQDRGIVILNYTVHPEYGFDYPRVRIRQHDLKRLSLYAKAVAEALVIADE